MGICNSLKSGGQARDKIAENLNLNYSYSLDEDKLKEISAKNLIKLNISLLHISRNKKTKDLMLKKLYINSFGKMIGEISNKKLNTNMIFDGNLDSKGNFKMDQTEEGNDLKSEIKYEGEIKVKESPYSFLIQGEASKQIIKGQRGNERFGFSLKFGEYLWILEYTFEDKNYTIKPFLDLNDNEMFVSNITGIAYEEDKGISIFSGIEDDKREITLTQNYINELHTSNDKKIYYIGTIDRIKFTIEGTIKGGIMDGSEFKIYRSKNPQ